MLGGCRSIMRTEIPLQVDLQNVIPPYWTPTEALRPLSIDGDADEEYILFYRYDNGTGENLGPIGAAIYDLQIDSGAVLGPEDEELVPVPNQPSGFFLPYRILPNYWPTTGNQFYVVPGAEFLPVAYYIAEPEDADKITITPIQRDPTVTSDNQYTLYNEMIIRGGDRHITSVWWENAFDGYGVAHLYAPGGFRNFEWEGTRDASPIKSVDGAFPMHDRSRLCRNYIYTRLDDEINVAKAKETSEKSIYYSAAELGIDFCDGTPTHPFYPEGVVLAYLLDADGRANVIDQSSDKTPTQLKQITSIKSGERIQNIRTQSVVPHPPREEGEVLYDLKPRVCVEIFDSANKPRYLLFTLKYNPPSLGASGAVGDIRTDQLFIVDVVKPDLDGVEACWNYVVENPLMTE